MAALLGRKLGMTQVCDSAGSFVAATVLKVGPCRVDCVRTEARDGYVASRLRLDPVSGGVAVSREFRGVELGGVGAEVSADSVDVARKVEVRGKSKGRGFAGVMKRHNFGGVCASHGVKKVHRSGGSTGQSTDPGRVFKGTKMPGRYGGGMVTVKGLSVHGVFPAESLLVVCGAVPGPTGGVLEVRQ